LIQERVNKHCPEQHSMPHHLLRTFLSPIAMIGLARSNCSMEATQLLLSYQFIISLRWSWRQFVLAKGQDI